MSVKIVKGSIELGRKIRLRRNELGFTIEDAADKAGVGTKTWSRYESGGSIRRDKVGSVCKTLNWHALPEDETQFQDFDIRKYKQREVWPQALADNLGDAAAISFVIGSDILLDNIEQDLNELSCRPKGTHLGELELSWLADCLPSQFLMRYDYDFLYYLKSILVHYRCQTVSRTCFVAHTVMEELVLYLVMKESEFLMEGILPYLQAEDEDAYYDWKSWPFDLFGDMDIVTFFYSGYYLTKENPYHFENWREEQFHCNR